MMINSLKFYLLWRTHGHLSEALLVKAYLTEGNIHLSTCSRRGDPYCQDTRCPGPWHCQAWWEVQSDQPEAEIQDSPLPHPPHPRGPKASHICSLRVSAPHQLSWHVAHNPAFTGKHVPCDSQLRSFSLI